ncbi:uncharacterized protein DDB_G0275275-like isoform X2 [Panonychus citri]|uniref:uncharacterized protein DDB_G0275275-like isoform X2 n=1 Tax=Panonychus citri TaxID=50023 RepID=UPI0023079A45|nr:uncharacterized protein DDB_G0275275-like isoform X2 [Panonychus citri]
MTHHQQYFTEESILPGGHPYCLSESIAGNLVPPTGNILSPPHLHPYHPYYTYDGFSAPSTSLLNCAGASLLNGCNGGSTVGIGITGSIEGKATTSSPLTISESSDDLPTAHPYCLEDSSTLGSNSNFGPTTMNISPPPLYPYHPYYTYDGCNSSPSSSVNFNGHSIGTFNGLSSYGNSPDTGCDFNLSSSSSSCDGTEGKPLTIAESSGSYHHKYFTFLNDEGQHNISYFAHHQYFTDEQPVHPYCLGDETSTTPAIGSNYGPTSNTLSPPHPYHPYYIYDGYNSSSSSSGYLNSSGNGNSSFGGPVTDSNGIGGFSGYINNNNNDNNSNNNSDLIETKPSTIDLPLMMADTFTSSGSSLSSGINGQTITSSSNNLKIQSKSQPLTLSTTPPPSTTTGTTTTTTTPPMKARRKKKEPVDYVLLDVNSAGDEKTEFIKYVGKGSYKCQICDIYSKNNKDYIQDHINIKHYNIKKNYECLLCNITFAWRSGAFKHLKKYHSIEGKNTINFFRAISKRHVYHSQRKRK